MTDTENTPADFPSQLDPAERWDYLLKIDSPTDQDCLHAFATEAGVITLGKFPNIVQRASRVLPQLPELLSTLGAELTAAAVRAHLGGADLRPAQSVLDAGDVFN